MKLTTDGSIAFPDKDVLRSSERTGYFNELSEFVKYWLPVLGESQLASLNALFHHGTLVNGRGNTLRLWEPCLICLCVPVLDEHFVRDVFKTYKMRSALEIAMLYRVHFDGRIRNDHTEVVDRLELIVVALASNECRFADDDIIPLHCQYLSLYCNVFGVLGRGNIELAEHMVGLRVAEFVEGMIGYLSETPAGSKRLASLMSDLAVLISGAVDNASLVYRFPFLVNFFERFLSGRLPPLLQGLVSEIYSGCSRKIKLDGEGIIFE